MTEFLQHILLCCLCITAIYMICRPWMLLGKPCNWLRLNLEEAVLKPLFECVICMASVWGTLFWLLFQPSITYYSWVSLPIFILAVAGINTIIAGTALKHFDEL